MSLEQFMTGASSAPKKNPVKAKTEPQEKLVNPPEQKTKKRRRKSVQKDKTESTIVELKAGDLVRVKAKFKKEIIVQDGRQDNDEAVIKSVFVDSSNPKLPYKGCYLHSDLHYRKYWRLEHLEKVS